jgi:hypothetical protein
MEFTESSIKKGRELLFIKSPFLRNYPTYSDIDLYLRGIKEIVNLEIPKIKKGGFLAIQTQDVRIDGYVEPLTKRLVDMLTIDSLWLKEIVVVTKEKQDLEIQIQSEYLKIFHQYLLVYEKRGE